MRRRDGKVQSLCIGTKTGIGMPDLGIQLVAANTEIGKANSERAGGVFAGRLIEELM